MKQIYSFILLYSITCFAISQEKIRISGSILNTFGNPIEYAHIKISSSNTGTLSNSSGDFSLVIPSKCNASLIISHIGYFTNSVNLDCSKKRVKVILKEEIEILSEVKINALTAEALVEKAISNLETNYYFDAINYVMFTRITEKIKNPILLQEYVYNIFSINGNRNEFNIIKSRSFAFDKKGEKRERKMTVTGLQTNESHLMLKYTKNFLKRKKMKRYEYSFLEDVLYEGELYYRIKVQSTKNDYTIGGEVWVHPSNYGIASLKILFKDENLEQRYTNRERESYYKLWNNKWLFSHGFYRYKKTASDSDDSVQYEQLTVATDFQFSRQFSKEEKLEYYTPKARKYYDSYSDDFWSDYNHIPLDSIFKSSLTGAKTP